MPDKKYLIDFPDAPDGSAVWEADKWERNKDAFMSEYKDSGVNVFELEDYNPEDVKEHDQIMISFDDNPEGSAVWDSAKWERNKDAFMAENPTAKIQRVRYKDYWGESATANREQRALLAQPDEERNARLADLGYYDDLTGEAFDYTQSEEGVPQWGPSLGLQPLSSVVGENEDGTTSYADPKVAEFFATDTSYTDRMAEIARLDAEYENNPSVIAQREYEAQWRAEQAKYAENLENQIRKDAKDAGHGNLERMQMRKAAPMLGMGHPLAVAQYNAMYADADLPDSEANNYTAALNMLELAKEARTVKDKKAWQALTDEAQRKFMAEILQPAGANYVKIGKILTRIEKEYGAIDEESLTPEKLDELLTKDEQALILSFMEYNAALADAQVDASTAYKGAQQFAKSVPFMLEMMVTGGLYNAAGKAATSKMTRSLMEWAAKKGAGKALRKFAAKSAIRLTYGAAGTLARTVATPSTYKAMAEGAASSMDDEGHMHKFKGGVVAGLDKYIENFSEITGDAFGIAGKTLAKSLGKIDFGKVGKLLADSNLAQKAGHFLANTNDLLKEFGFHGFVGEIGEELIGSAIREVSFVQPGALKEMFEGDNFGAMLIGFAPMSLFGAGMSAVSMGAMSIEAANLGKKLRETLGYHYNEEQIDHMMNLVSKAKNGDQVMEAITPLLDGLTKEEGQQLLQYGAFMAQNKAMLFAKKAQDDNLAQAKRAELQQTYNKFWQQDAEGAESVQMAELRDGRTVFVTSAPNENGVVSIIDAQTGKQGFTNVSEYAEQTDKEGNTTQKTRTWSMDAYLESQIARDRMTAQEARMTREYNEQVQNLQSQIKSGTKINLGTQGNPIWMVATGQTSKDGVFAIDSTGATHTIGWNQVADAMNQPIRVKTDQEIIDEEVAAVVARNAERRRQMSNATPAMTEAVDESAAQSAEVVAQENRHIPMNEDGTVNEIAFWEQDPEGYAAWNDEQNQDGGADTRQQIANSKAILAQMLNEAIAQQQTSNPVVRKQAKKNAEDIQAQIDKLTALEAKYEEQRIAPFRERAMKWKGLTNAPVHIIETEEELAKISSDAANASGRGARVRGMAKDGKAYIYLPGIVEASEIDAVFMHEAVAHTGLKGMLGQQAFDELCDQVWEMMSPEARQVFIGYPGVNGNKRAAADEYIAHIAERMGAGVATAEEKTIWQKIVDFVRNVLRAMGVDINLSESELADLLQMAYADLAKNMAEAEKIAAQNEAAAKARMNAPTAAQQKYDEYITKGLTAEEIKAGAQNEFNAAQQAYNDLQAQAPKVEMGESVEDFIARKKAYNDKLAKAKALLDEKQTMMDEIARREKPAEEAPTPVVEETEEATPSDERLSIVSLAESVGLKFGKVGNATVFRDTKGDIVENVTPEMVRDSRLGDMIKSSVGNGFIKAEDAEKQYKFFSDLFTMMQNIQDVDLVWATSGAIGFQPIKDTDLDENGMYVPKRADEQQKFAAITGNSDKQYAKTIDFTTICLKTQAVIDVMSKSMVQLGRGLTREEIIDVVYNETHKAGEPVPCPVCYVFSRWVGLGGLLGKMKRLQQQYGQMPTEEVAAKVKELEEEVKRRRQITEGDFASKDLAKVLGELSDKQTQLKDMLTLLHSGNVTMSTEQYYDLVDSIVAELGAERDQRLILGSRLSTGLQEALDTLESELDLYNEYAWLKKVRLHPEYKEKGEVPDDILFDINRGLDFAVDYPVAWGYRTTRGPALGKAAAPYSPLKVGQVITGIASDVETAREDAKNPFLALNATDKERKAIITKAIHKARVQNLRNGQRWQSTSDFRFEYVLDVLMGMLEMQAAGSKVQLYTKVPEAVPLFASMGAEVNCSLMPLGDGLRDGELVFSPITGMDGRDARMLFERFNNVQPIMVGISDAHIRACMREHWITFIIPYHASGGSQESYVSMMETVEEAVKDRTDYSDYQSDRVSDKPTEEQKSAREVRKAILSGAYLTQNPTKAEKETMRRVPFLETMYERFYAMTLDGKSLEKQKDYFHAFYSAGDATLGNMPIMPFEYWDYSSVYKETYEEGDIPASVNGRRFMDYCAALGVTPRFSGYNKDGVYNETKDFTNEDGYWKVLIDRSMYNRDGSYHVQRPIDITNVDTTYFTDKDGNMLPSQMSGEDAAKVLYESRTEGQGVVNPSKLNDPTKVGEITEKVLERIDEAERTRVPEMVEMSTFVRKVDERNRKASADLEAKVVKAEKKVDAAKEKVQLELSKMLDIDATIKSGTLSGRQLVSAEAKLAKAKAAVQAANAKYEEAVNNRDNLAEELAYNFGKDRTKVFDIRDGKAVLSEEMAAGLSGDTRLSVITPQMDADYLAAVERGDMETAQRMVDAAARAAGYDSPKLYHGTRNFGFTKIDTSKSDDGFSFFTTESPIIAQTYSGVKGERRINEAMEEADRKKLAEPYEEEANEYLLEHTRELAEWLNIEGRGIDIDEFATRVTDMIYDIEEWAIKESKNSLDVLIHTIKTYDTILEEYYDKEKYASVEEQIKADDGTWDARLQVAKAIGKYVDVMNREGSFGNYSFYANTWAMLEVECNGSNWNNIKSADLPYRGGRAWNTREVAKYAKEEGWLGVVYKNLTDLGPRAEVAEWQRNTNIYNFFRPQQQVKSADPVTYDDAGNAIPLSERFNPENSDIRFSARTEEQRDALFDAAKARFGLTNNFNGAGYMLPDGSLLDFSEANDGGNPNQRSLDHREIEGIIMDEGREYDSRWMYLADFMNEGAIRLLPEYAGINLMKAPTKEQRQRLFDFIYKYNGEVILEIADDRLNNVAYVEYDRRTSPSRIFRDIDGYFNEGIVPQQDVRFSVIGEVGALRDKTPEGITRLENLDVARQMESQLNPDWSAKENEAALKIKIATGWERGADGLWRYEVEDVMIKPFGEWLDNKKKLKVKDILTDGTVLKLYPDIAEITIVKDKSTTNMGAAYNGTKNTIKLPFGALRAAFEAYKKGGDEQDLQMDVVNFYTDILHEVQHAIQHREGFAKGGSSATLNNQAANDRYLELREEYNAKVDELNAIPSNERVRSNPKAMALYMEANRIDAEMKRLRARYAVGKAGYRRLAGEVESRNVEERAAMTDEQKRNTLLSSTEDVARKDQIFIFRDIKKMEDELRYSVVNENQAIFVSNAARAVEGIKMEKATPAQWLAMIEKNGGLKAGEDKWMGLSDWLKASDRKTLTKAEVLDFIGEHMIKIEEQHYGEMDEETREFVTDNSIINMYGVSFRDSFNSAFVIEEDFRGEWYVDVQDYEEAVSLYNEHNEGKITIDPADIEYESREETLLKEWATSVLKNAEQNDGVKPINTTREKYTTEGLDNLHEIALTVPTIESWNESDDIHFGDAGEGRAVAWIRFGETTDEAGNNILVIDEIQSKRHQEGREKGYARGPKVSLTELKQKAQDFEQEMIDKYHPKDLGLVPFSSAMRGVWTEEESNTYSEMMSALGGAAMKNIGIPDAPFDKNWHELAMKRMLRYAAENGYDIIAWTKGEQQTERYGLGGYVSSIEMMEEHDGIIDYLFYVKGREESSIVGVEKESGLVALAEEPLSQAEGKPLSDLVGKEMAVRMMQMQESEVLEGANLQIGGEGMKGFYDKMLPAFMNKYGKKWGIKVADITLPNVEEAGRVMHSVPVTEEMKASVMEGQVMFSAVQIDPAVRQEMDTIKAKAMWNGTFMKAPNGAETKLTEDQWLMVRTKNFINWFGDWINDPENASKVVDENGEPRVVYHGGAWRPALEEPGKAKFRMRSGLMGRGAYFTDNFTSAADYAREKYEWEYYKEIDEDFVYDNGYITEAFLNIRDEDNIREYYGETYYLATNPSQIKSATETTGLFSESGDIRFSANFASPMDSKGSTLTQSQRAFFGNSKAVDKDGNLLVLYHGTPRAGFTEFESGWFTTSKEDAISYSGDRKGRLFDPNEKYEPETLTAGDFPLGYMTFDSEEDRAAFLDKFPYAEEVMSERDYEDARMGAEDEEYDALTARRGQFAEVWNAYREYERERFVDTTVGDLIANPDAYTEEDFMRAMLEYDSNASLDALDDMTAEERKDALVSALINANEEAEGGISDMVVPTRVPRNGEGVKHNDLGNRTYEVYVNIENPYEIDANGRGSEFESGDVYKAVEDALADAQYDGVIIRNWRVGRTQQLGDVVVPKNGLQVKLTSNENPVESEDARFSAVTETEEVEPRFSVVTDPALLDQLNNEEYITLYRAMQVVDGGLYQPMAGKVAYEEGEEPVWGDPIPEQTWLQSDETPWNAVHARYDKATKNHKKGDLKYDKEGNPVWVFKLNKGNGKSLYANYNPYIHTSFSPLNDQFSEAQDRENLVVVRVLVPKSELTSGYKAEKAHDAVGTMPWHSGPISGVLAQYEGKERVVMLTRYAKINGIVPWTEVADEAMKLFEDTELLKHPLPTNVFMKGLREELERRGVQFVKTDNGGEILEGEHKGKTWASIYGKDGLGKKPKEPKKSKKANNVRFSAISTPTDNVVAEGMKFSIQDFARLAGNIFQDMPESFRKEAIEETFKRGWDMQSAIFQIPARLAEKENWDEADKDLAKVIREKVQDAMDESGVVMSRPLTTKEALWMLYRSTEANGDSMLDAAKRAIVAHNLGFDSRSMALKEKADDYIRYSVVRNGQIDAATDMYNYEANLWTNRLKESWLDMNQSVIALQNALADASGKPIASWEDVVLALNQLSSKSYADKKKFMRDYLEPLWDNVRDKVKRSGLSVEQIERYMMLKHGVERNKKFAMRDAKQFYKEMFDKVADRMKNTSHAEQVVALSEANKRIADIDAQIATASGKKLKDLQEARERAVVEKEIAELVLRNDAAQNAQDLQDYYDNIDNELNPKYWEFREKDYGGLTSMFMDQIADVRRKDYKTEEAYQAALLASVRPRFDKVADMEAAAQAEIDGYEKRAYMPTLWDAVNAATKEILRHQHASGMITTEQYDAVRNMFDFYVPLRGFADNTAEDMYSYYMNNSAGGFAKPIIAAKGRKTRAESPLGWIGAMAESAIQQDNKNEAKMKLYYALMNRPDTGVLSLTEMWYEFSHLDPNTGKKVFVPAYPPATNGVLSADQMRQHMDTWEQGMRAKMATGQAYKKEQGVNLGGSVIFQDTAQDAEHIIRVKVAGKDYAIVVNGNPRAAQAINGLLNPDANVGPVRQWYGELRRGMSALMTSFSPLFWVANYQRDLLSSFMRTSESEGWKQAFKYLGNRFHGWKAAKYIYRYDNGKMDNSYYDTLYKEFAENGGITGYTFLTTNKEYEKLLEDYIKNEGKEFRNWVKGVWDKFMGFGEAIEQVSRFAAYITARESGKSIEESVAAAKEVSVNFNRKGSAKPISLDELERLRDKNGKPLNAPKKAMAIVFSAMPLALKELYFFFNASIQALSSSAKLAKKSPGKAVTWAGAYMGLSVGLAFLNYLLAGDDDDNDYLDLPDYLRHSTALFKMGDNYYFKWSLPQEMRPFYATADILVSKIMGKTPHKTAWATAGDVALATAEWLPVNPFGTEDPILALVPDAFAPLAEIRANQNSFGGRIYNDMSFKSEDVAKQIPAYRKGTSKTGEIYVDMAEFLNDITGGDEVQKGIINLNPAIVEHLVEGYGGGIYDFGKMIIGIPRLIDEAVWGEGVEVRDIPFVNKVLLSTDETNMNSHVNEAFYHYQGIADNAKRVENEYRKSDEPSRADDYMAEDDWRIYMLFRQYEEDLKMADEKVLDAVDDTEKDVAFQEQNVIREMLLNDIARGVRPSTETVIKVAVESIRKESNDLLKPSREAERKLDEAKRRKNEQAADAAKREFDSLRDLPEYKRGMSLKKDLDKIKRNLDKLQYMSPGTQRDSVLDKVQRDYDALLKKARVE